MDIVGHDKISNAEKELLKQARVGHDEEPGQELSVANPVSVQNSAGQHDAPYSADLENDPLRRTLRFADLANLDTFAAIATFSGPSPTADYISHDAAPGSSCALISGNLGCAANTVER